MPEQPGFWDEETRLAALAEESNSLVKMNVLTLWEHFRAPIEEASDRSDGGKGACPICDAIPMFKCRFYSRFVSQAM